MKTAALALAALALAPACIIVVHDGAGFAASGPAERGSGVAATEHRDAGPFTRVRVAGVGDVSIAVGGETAVAVTADDNLIGHLLTRVEDGTLVVAVEGGRYAFRRGPDVRVSTPSLEALHLTGSADVRVSGLSGGSFAIHVSGSGDVRAEGDVERLEATVSGSGDLHLRNLRAAEATVRVSGSGDVDLTATRRIEARITGSGDVRYRGDPGEISTSVAGSGSITRL